MRAAGRSIAALALLGWTLSQPLVASEADALAISANIRAIHMPFGTILEPIFASPTSTQIVSYTDCGDSALWTGAYLAAESFRYNVTKAPDALNNVQYALAGLKALADVTGDNRLARCMVAANSPFAADIQSQESSNTVHQAPPWIWVDNTSRDEVVGAFFGLCVAFDRVDDATVKAGVSALATRLLGFISGHNWTPNDDISNTFLVRPEELQMLVQVGRHVNPANGISGPLLVPPVDVAVRFDVGSNSSYFKFNLDYMTFYNLLRLQNNGDNLAAYQVVRNYTASHQNAFFDIVDRVLQGPNAARDTEMSSLLNQWLARPHRDFKVDLTHTVAVCGSEACQPVPVPLRPPTDFLWQRDPFQLTGGGDGFIEAPGIDYLLPYWMARYYGVAVANVQSAAAPSIAVAANSLASLFGANFAAGTAQAMNQPLPMSLGGITLTVTDSAGTSRNAPLVYVSQSQINFVVPDGTTPGIASFVVNNGSASQTVTGTVQAVAPTLFTMNGAGTGVAAAIGIRVSNANPQQQTIVPVFQCDNSGCTSVPIALTSDSTVIVEFYGTGIRNHSTGGVTAKIGGVNATVQYAGPAPGFTGLDQVNVSLPASLAGSKETNVVLTVDGQSANTETINIR